MSGGPDSLALLLLANDVLPGDFEAATVDHGLRLEAAAEASMVAAVCEQRGIAHRTIRLGLSEGARLQERARAARYAALAGWVRERGLGALVTAHHRDDQVETLVMRLNRGAGVRGLAAMRAYSAVLGDPALPLLRPLLGWSRNDLRGVVDRAGLRPAEDPSNRDQRFERVRVRDGMARCDWLDPAGLAAAARHCADASDALDWAAGVEWSNVAGTTDTWTYAPSAPRAVRLRVLARIIQELGGKAPLGADCARWLDALEAGAIATLGGVRGDGRAMRWVFTRARAHRLPD